MNENETGIPEVSFEQVESAFDRWAAFCLLNAPRDEEETKAASLVLCELLGLDEGTLRLAAERMTDMLGHPAAATAGMCGFFVGLLLADERDLALVPEE